MLEDGRITHKQFILLLFTSRIIIILTYVPAFASPPANQDVWLSGLLTFPIHLLFSLPVFFLWKRFPDQSIIQYSQTIMGKAGKIIAILYLWFFIHFAAITLAQFSVFIITAVMPETPILFLSISLAVFCCYAARKGIEVMGRMSEIIAPVILIAILIIVALLIKDFDLKALTPVMEAGFFPVLHGGLTISARGAEILGFAMLLPYLNDRKKANTALVWIFFLYLITFLVTAIPIICILGPDDAKNLTFPFFSTVRMVNVGDFLERTEAIHMGVWLLGVFIKISLYFYLSALGLGQLFSLQDYKPLVIPVGTLIVPLSILIAPSIVELREFTGYKIFTWYSLFYIILIPIMLLIMAMLRKQGIRGR